ncbi:peripherin-2 isoform X2 [Andrena cerasifolii]|uniref:peripherin-2 isoform X2 n=1 Tax=Andrena cerasifolii TaxID=2819439 RepID=UPI004037715B
MKNIDGAWRRKAPAEFATGSFQGQSIARRSCGFRRQFAGSLSAVCDPHGAAARPWMNLRLLAWTMMGLFLVFVGCFMASICFSTAEQLGLQVRETLVEGMKRYFTDVSWKRRIDTMQVHLRCCGIDSSSDWHKTYWLPRDLLVLDSPDILKYAELDGRVTPPVVPWSCCRIDVKGPCYHDPLQLPNPEQNSTRESLNARGCLIVMKTVLNGALYSAVVLIVFLFVSQKNSGRGDSMIDLKPLVYSSDTE